MAKEYKITIPAHPNIYEYSEREINVYFCEPENGITQSTGILLIVPDFGDIAIGENTAELRSVLSDVHNMVTIQCDYFGQKFMRTSQSPSFNFNINELRRIFTPEEFGQIYVDGRVNVSKILDFGKKYPINLSGIEQLDESIVEFNDMGIMQALDHLTAVQVVSEILKDNEYIFNAGKVFAYGSGHGSYLAYLCNAFAPRLFSLIIDNSGWIFPPYVDNNRTLSTKSGLLTTTITFDYIAKRIDYDRELLQLSSLYKKFVNYCNILSFHGTTDHMTPIKNKKTFCQSLKHCMFNEVSDDQIDGKIFKTTGQGLGTDPIKFFNYIMQNKFIPLETYTELNLPTTIINTRQNRFVINYSGGVPLLIIHSKLKS